MALHDPHAYGERWFRCPRCGTTQPPRALKTAGEERVCLDDGWCSRAAGEGKGEMPKALTGEVPETVPGAVPPKAG